MWQHDKAREAEKKCDAAPCPFDGYASHRQEQVVAEYARCTMMEARALGESDLDLFNDYLFEAVAVNEARVIAEAIATAEAKNKAQLDQMARDSVGR